MTNLNPASLLVDMDNDNKEGYSIQPKHSIDIDTKSVVADELMKFTDDLIVGQSYTLVNIKLVSVNGQIVSERQLFFDTLESANEFTQHFDALRV